eukprot:ANDGO_08445.mRNA.1 LEC14B protein
MPVTVSRHAAGQQTLLRQEHSSLCSAQGRGDRSSGGGGGGSDVLSALRSSSRSPAPYRAVLSNLIPNHPAQCVHHASSRVFCGAFSHSGDVFMAAQQTNQVKLFETAEIEQAMSEKRKASPFLSLSVPFSGWAIADVAFSPDDSVGVSAHWGSSLYCFSMAKSDAPPAEEPATSDGSVENSVSLSKRSGLGSPQQLRGKSIDLGVSDDEFGADEAMCVFSVRFAARTGTVVCGTSGGFLFEVDVVNGERIRVRRGHTDDANALAVADETGNVFVSGGDDGLICLWDRRSPEFHVPSGMFMGHLAGVAYLDSRGDGRYFLSSSKDQTIKLWDLRRASSTISQDDVQAAGLLHHDYRYGNVGFNIEDAPVHPSDTSVMTYCGSHTLTGTLIRARFSPRETTGQQYIYTGSADGSVVVYDILSGRTVSSKTFHSYIVRDVSWHPFLPLLVTSGWDGNIVAWDYVEPPERKDPALPFGRSLFVHESPYADAAELNEQETLEVQQIIAAVRAGRWEGYDENENENENDASVSEEDGEDVD